MYGGEGSELGGLTVDAVLSDETGLVGADTAGSMLVMFQSSSDSPQVDSTRSRMVIGASSESSSDVPLTGALAVVTGAAVPDGFVRHVGSS